MTETGGELQGAEITTDGGQPVTCDECEYGLFLVDLMIPGGLRFTCRGCDTVYDKRQLETIGRKLAKR